MAEERVLDGGRIDALAAGPDHVLYPVIDKDIPVIVHVRSVAGAHSPVANRSRGRVGLVPVSLHDDGGPDQDFPDGATRDFRLVVSHDLELKTRPRHSAGTQLAFPRIVIRIG